MAKVIAHIKEVPFQIEIKTPTGNIITADEPVEKGGKDTGFSPKELLTASLSACTLATLRMYINKKGWNIPEIKVETELIEMDGKTLFARKLEFLSTVDEDQKKRLILVANACPVHKILSGTIEIETELI
ncbi:OsmC family peroxiredoxin [Flavobacterium aquariorum]|uniref:OsmC family peroxiredoxin n=1 Tax=Flavobacterium aquariorum TaxID=2217670 RepID=A0A2W7VI63_9FLAO|nr:OsmC family protein [Flavobacterium aquariorum]PZX92002.1 OsmC family peroxiredoxin [Flavobacterium aquariorum]